MEERQVPKSTVPAQTQPDSMSVIVNSSVADTVQTSGSSQATQPFGRKRKSAIPTKAQRSKRRRLNPYNVEVPFNVKDVADAFKQANKLLNATSAPPSTKPDFFCPVSNKCEVYNNYRCVLNLTDIASNVNKFCVMQVLKTYQHHYNFYVWSRCGRVGERGTMLLKGPMSEMRAAMDFTKRFGRKTGRRWVEKEKDDTTDTEHQEEDDFLPRKFSYIDVIDVQENKQATWSRRGSIFSSALDKTLNWMQGSVPVVGSSKKSGKFTMPCAECLARLASGQQSSSACTKCLTGTIEKTNNCEECLKELECGNTPYEQCARCLVKFAVDNDLYDRMRKDLEHGDTMYSPLGRLTKLQLTRGAVILTHLEEAIMDGASTSELAFLSSLFYTAIPHDFARRPPPVVSGLPLLVKELGLLITFYMISSV